MDKISEVFPDKRRLSSGNINSNYYCSRLALVDIFLRIPFDVFSGSGIHSYFIAIVYK